MKGYSLVILLTAFFSQLITHAVAETSKPTVDFKEFLGQHDLVWDRLPNRWEVAPYSGNGNPVIESPLSFATSLHDMLLQSWGGKIRVFPGTPERWEDVAFDKFRAQGAFLVSASKKAGETQFVKVESLVGSPCMVKVDIVNPKIYIDGKLVMKEQLKQSGAGFYDVALKKGESVIFVPVALEEANLSVKPIPVPEVDRNIFGLNSKSQERIPGHQFYYPVK
ncbi:MAG: glycoside hydrolase family 95-like protein [Akkermansiaceae bacterium]